MLAALSIRDIVLIDRLDLTFEPGLCVLTGETGAGKSILLDSLGLALGGRAEARFVRDGAERAVVSVQFELPPDHPALELLREQDMSTDGLIIRRTIAADGRSRAFINDSPASAGLLRQIGDLLVEVQGQHDARGLMDAGTHRPLLDAYGRTEDARAATASAWRTWREAEAKRQAAEAGAARARQNEELLRDALDELDRLDPKPGEEDSLAEARATLMSRERIVEALQAAQADLAGGRGVDATLRAAQRALERAAERAGGLFDAALAALERAAIEVDDALGELDSAARRIDGGGARLEEIEERLFALRAAARKHGVAVDGLAELRESVRNQLDALDDEGGSLARLAAAETAARDAYLTASRDLTRARQRAAATLDLAVNAELAPLKLDRASFRTLIEALPETGWGPQGSDRVAFEVATNPGRPFGPLARIASGGELSRFMLALKVVLATAGSARTLVFDEVDAGVGGAVAAAVGARLARLAETVQILVVTHSPQVAARGQQHLRVAKGEAAAGVVTRVETLGAAERREEIARMLSGARITDAARAAAASLMAPGEA